METDESVMSHSYGLINDTAPAISMEVIAVAFHVKLELEEPCNVFVALFVTKVLASK